MTTGCATNTDLIWQESFESGDLSGWTHLLNPQGLSVQDECVYDGNYAGRVTLTGEPEMLWNGNENLNRAEFSYTPAPGVVGENKDTFFGWSFYLKQALTDTKHEIGYWESGKSYRQMLRFNITGTDFSFQASDQKAPFWTAEKFARPGIWRDVVIHIHWSTNPRQGFAQVWLDGRHMGKHHFKTLYSADENMFTQIGLLRSRQPVIETLLVDRVRHGRDLRSVLADSALEKSIHCSGRKSAEL